MRTKESLCTLRTDGKGYWSVHARDVNVYDICAYITEYGDNDYFGELRVYFDPDEWNVNEHGLIYTDPLFIKLFHTYLILHGFSKEAVAAATYSEQGMQGDNYVSLDIENAFIKELDPFINFVRSSEKTIEIKVILTD